jgi:serine/threonine protein kinase
MGIILYGLVIGEVPFRSKTRDDLKAMIIKKDIFFDSSNEKIHSHFSGELKDLLKKMLMKKPSQRISIPEIFEHPWMAKYKE